MAIIQGDSDTASPPEQGEALARLIALPLFILQEAGNIPQIEAPGEFQASLAAVISDR